MSNPEIAITGYAARLPGASNVQNVWSVLSEGRCTVGPWDSTRWSQEKFYHPSPAAAGYTYAQRAGLLSDVWQFDNAAFGISPREAAQMDPQQRILLEVCAEAVSAAGLYGGDWDKSRTGVYIGASSSDHSMGFAGDFGAIEQHFMLGNTLSIMSNRISFHFDLTGPSYTVDTACSSSLFALDQAAKALAAGEIDTAIVGGVNVLLSPMPFIGFSRATMLSPDGLCKAFDENANGYVRSEGCVVFVLRRLDLAKAAEDHVRGVLVSTGVNSDGRTVGMSLPNGQRQSDLMSSVLEKSGVDVNDVAFVEAHGTGTAVGDPEEAGAIGRAYGKDRSKPIAIGSAKSNFGHLEPVSGLVGLLKAQLALENGIYPETLHVGALNPNIPFEDHNVAVAVEPHKLPKRKEPWFAGVNSFGFGGANAHSIIRQPTQSEQSHTARKSDPKALVLSANSPELLKARAKQWADHIHQADPATARRHIGSANHRQEWQEHRLVVHTGDLGELVTELNGFEAGDASSKISAGAALGKNPAIAFAFSGNGSQWDGMGREQFVKDTVFRASFEETNARFKDLGCEDLKQLLFSPRLGEALTRATVAQPVLFAMQLATVDMMASFGITPSAVVGHSVGEVAAACVAGGLSRADAVELVYRRSVALETLHEQGTMAAVASDQERIEGLLDGFGGEVSLAGINSPKSCTISGPSDAIDEFMRFAKLQRIAGRKLGISYPYHSHLVEPLKERLIDDLSYLKPQASSIPIYSSTNGALVRGEDMDVEYWWRNARNPVLFSDASEAMLRDETALVAEISAKPVLRTYIRDVADLKGLSQGYVATLDDRNPGSRTAERIAAEAAILGADIDRAALIGEATPFSGDLPLPLWDHKTHRVPGDRDRMDLFATQSVHPLLGARMRVDGTIWSSKIDSERLPWLGDHKVLGRVLFPATGYLEMCLAVAAIVMPDQAIEVDDLDIQRPIVLEGAKRVELRTTYTQQTHRVSIEYRPADTSQPWTVAAQAVLWPKVREMTPPAVLEDGQEVDTKALYEGLSGLGYEYGPAFAKLETLAISEEIAVAELGASELADSGMRLDPSLADAALHAILAMLDARDALSAEDAMRFLPTRIGRCTMLASRANPARAVVRILKLSSTSVRVDLSFEDETGAVFAQISDMVLAAVPAGQDTGVDQHWVMRKVPVAGPLEQSPVARIWSDPAEELAALGFLAEAHPEPDDGALLLDALAHRHAWDLIVENEGKPLTSTRKLRAASAALVSADAAEWDAEARRLNLVDTCPWPDASVLIDALVRTAPELAPDLQSALRTLSGEPREEQLPASSLWRAAGASLQDFLSKMPARELGLRLLVIGRPISSFVAELGVLPGVGAVAIGLSDEAEAEAVQASLNIPANIRVASIDDLSTPRGFDLILSVDALGALKREALAKLATALEPGGFLLGFEQEPTPYDTLLASGEGTSRRGAEANVARMEETGFANLGHGAFAESGIAASILFARGALPDETPQEKPQSVMVLGGSDTAEALSTALPDAGVLVKKVAETAVTVLSGAYGDLDAKGEMIRLARDLHALLDIKAKKLWVVCPDGLEAAAYAGFLRVLLNERPKLAVTLVRADYDDETAIEMIASAIARGSEEPELIVSEEGIAGLRVAKAETPEPFVQGGSVALGLGKRRTIEELRWQSHERVEPGPGAVEIEVAATGLNFRDVMWAQGLLPPEALEDGFAGATLGMECSGRVSKAGPGSAFGVGDPVIAFSSRSFASHVMVEDAAVAKLPEGLDLAQAAALPTAFFTSVYALNEVARVRKGEIVLIHGGAGGVGLTSLQVAKAAGAKVFATAGSPWKRALLKALGADEVFASRSLSFADDVMKATNGRGVDVVVNSLAGLAMEQSIKCLATFGRFIELGKKDYYANTAIGLRDLRRNIGYFGVDVDQLLAGRPEIAAEVMAHITDGFARGEYFLPPVEVFEAEDVHSAFRLMQKSGHIGKIVVRAPKLPKAVAKPIAAKPIRGAWLVVGGTSGFGLESANWLGANGAEALWLVSRSGGEPDVACDIPAHIRAVDVTKASDVAGLLAEIDASGVPLRGVLHAAMVLDDGFLADQTPERLSKVMAPKAAGASVLDRLTRGIKLDHFVLYSSITTVFGNPGQAGYVAANAWLEALAEERVAAGLPAQAIGWGPISDAGYLTRHETLGDTLKLQLGGAMLDSDAALGALGQILRNGSAEPVEYVAPVKWGRLAKDLKLVRSPMFDHVDTSGEAIGGVEALDIAELVRKEGPGAAQKKVLDVLRIQAGEILRQPKAEIDPTKPLTDMGFDSLLAVSLRMTVEERFGLEIPQVAITDSLTLRDLAAQMVADCGAEGEAVAQDADTLATVRKHVGGDATLSGETLNTLEQAALEVKSLTGGTRAAKSGD